MTKSPLSRSGVFASSRNRYSASFCEDGDGKSSDEGSAGGERIVGTDGLDELSGTQGNDLLRGGSGDDSLYAAYNLPAELAPNASLDLLFGGESDDFSDSADAKGAADMVYCGLGDDLVVADAEDFVADDCEEIHRR